MKIKKLCASALLLAMFVTTFTGCFGSFAQKADDVEEPDEQPIPYNAVMYDRAVDWLMPEYRKEHLTFDCQYHGVDIDTSDRSYPKERSVVLSSQEDFKKAFAEFPEEIDFEKEMLILYFFTDDLNGYSCKIKTIESDGQTLNLSFLHNKRLDTGEPVGDASAPMLRCLAVKMERIPVQSVNVKIIFEHYDSDQ